MWINFHNWISLLILFNEVVLLCLYNVAFNHTRMWIRVFWCSPPCKDSSCEASQSLVSFSFVTSKKHPTSLKEEKKKGKTPKRKIKRLPVKVKRSLVTVWHEFYFVVSSHCLWVTGIFPQQFFLRLFSGHLNVYEYGHPIDVNVWGTLQPTTHTYSHHPHNIVQLDLIRKKNKGNVVPQPAGVPSLGTSGSFSLLCFCY